jgi:hypothetical protein
MNPQGLDPSIMMLLAGAGIPTLLEALSKIMPKGAAKNPAAPSAGLPHRPGMRVATGGPPGTTTIAPSMLQALMQRGRQPQPQQPQPGAQMNPQALLQMLAQRGAV